MIMEYVLRDSWGYRVASWPNEPTREELANAMGLEPFADLGNYKGWHGMEDTSEDNDTLRYRV